MFDFVVKEYGKKKDRELLYHILAHTHFLIEQNEFLMAKVADLQASIDAQTTAIANLPQAGAPGISEAELDPINAQIQQNTADLVAKTTPPTA